MRLPGRKFLLAGRGGLNLTHAEPFDDFLARYRENGAHLEPHIRAFPPQALRDWADGLGAETFVGSSRRVFPKIMKASPLLRAWLQRLAGLQVAFVGQARLAALSEGQAIVAIGGRRERLSYDATILALGGASWPELGSDGAWAAMLTQSQVEVTPLTPSNAGILVDWPAPILALAGKPLKRIGVRVGEAAFYGEAILTQSGLEGGAIYAANGAVRALAAQTGWPISIELDLQLARSAQDLHARLQQRDRKRSLGPWMRANLGLSEAASRLVSPLAPSRMPAAVAQAIKQLPLKVRGFAPIARAISSAGGVRWGSLNPDLSLKAAPHIFVAGEMLDWDAPTGGYLLQACFATGRAAALSALAYGRARLSEP